MTGLYDSFQRPINYLRISVTDRCNLRCLYCMPPDGVSQVRHEDILSYEEIYKVVNAASELGIRKIRLTGGEPLVRLKLPDLIKMLGSLDKIDDISLTTNGTLLRQYVDELKQAGLARVNISLDTLKPERFENIARSRVGLSEVLAGIEAARTAGLTPVKINMVVMGEVNDDEILDFARKTLKEEWHVRFIEYMPLPNLDAPVRFVSVADIKKRLAELGELSPCLPRVGNGPARYFRLPHSRGSIGFISPVSQHFCVGCNRLRLTADGRLRLCLLSEQEIDLRSPLRSGATLSELKDLIATAVRQKPQRHGLAEGRVPSDRTMTQVGG